MTGDKGLCGSFNTNVIKAGGTYIIDSAQNCTLGLVGRKGRDFFGRRGFAVLFEQIGIFQKLRYEDARVIAQTAIDAFLAGAVDRVMLVYNEFRSVMTQRVVVDQLLPIARADVDAAAAAHRAGAGGDPRQIDYLYEPSTRRRFSTSCCRATSRCRSTARCSSRTRRSSRRR